MKVLMKMAGSKMDAITAHRELLRRKGHMATSPLAAGLGWAGAAGTGGTIGYYVGKRSPLHRKRSKKSRRKKEREARRWAAGMTAGAGALGAGVQMLTNRHTKKKYKHYSDEDLKKVIEKHPELTSGYEDFHKK